ncbi:hypothetical protein V1477_014658, partial [Vespula maculifrons]
MKTIIDFLIFETPRTYFQSQLEFRRRRVQFVSPLLSDSKDVLSKSVRIQTSQSSVRLSIIISYANEKNHKEMRKKYSKRQKEALKDDVIHAESFWEQSNTN